jgi:DNA-binding transcriptional LysR family regulator
VLPELRELRYFVAVAEEGTFTAAAQRLHLSQQSVSAAIHQIERRLGVDLLQRRGRGLRLTEAGEAFLTGARLTLASATDTIEHTLDAAKHPRLRIGYTVLAAAELTTPMIATLQARQPGLEVQLRLADFDDPSAGLSRGAVDIALLRRPVAGPLDFEDLFSERRVVVLHVDHPLAGRREVAIDELADEPIIADPGPDRTWREFWMGCDLRSHPPAQTVTVDSFDDELATVALGNAISITSAAAARLHPRPDLVYVPLRDATPCTTSLAWASAAPPPLLPQIIAAARRVRNKAHADGTFDRYHWTLPDGNDRAREQEPHARATPAATDRE